MTVRNPLAPPFFNALKAFPVMHSPGRRANSVQFRVRAPLLTAIRNGGHAQASQSSQRSSRFHKPALPRAALGIATTLPPCSSLRIAFVKRFCRSNTGWRIQISHFRFERVVQKELEDPADRESASLGGALHFATANNLFGKLFLQDLGDLIPAAPTIFRPASIKVMQRTFNP